MTHFVIALTSGLCVIPTIVIGGARLMFADDTGGMGNAFFWSSVGFGSVLAAVIASPFRRMPLWTAILLGPVVVLLTLLIRILPHIDAI